MSKIFIDRVHKIVINNITDETFGVGDLASQLNLSKSQTLRKIKAKQSSIFFVPIPTISYNFKF